MKNIFILLFFFTSFFGCSTSKVKQELNPEFIYKKDMIIDIDGIEAEGVAVIPKKETHKFHITARGDLDLFTFTTCHREEIAEKAWNVNERRGRWIFRRTIEKKREVKLDYTPGEIERSGGCPVFVGGYEVKGGRHSWGMVDFETDEAKLVAKINCNGLEYDSNGVSICQSREGLIQKISFQDVVYLLPEENCSIGKTEGKEFEFKIKKGECVYAFMDSKKQIHRLTTFGYEKILIRE